MCEILNIESPGKIKVWGVFVYLYIVDFDLIFVQKGVVKKSWMIISDTQSVFGTMLRILKKPSIFTFSTRFHKAGFDLLKSNLILYKSNVVNEMAQAFKKFWCLYKMKKKKTQKDQNDLYHSR